MSGGTAEMAATLRSIAKSDELLEVARLAVEDALVEWRDNGRFMLRRNGFAIANYDSTPSSIIRFSTEIGVAIALRAIADQLCRPAPDHSDPEATS